MQQYHRKCGEKMPNNLTNNFPKLKLVVSPKVYEPAEDSYLLASYAKNLSGTVLDMGTGCGIVCLYASFYAKKAIGVDINPKAIECAKKNAQLNNIKNVEFYISDLFSNVKGKFDFILFNPPYLPTSKEETLKDSYENMAFDGGKDGLEVFLKFSEQLPSFLNQKAKVLVVISSLHDGIEKACNILEKQVGYTKIIAEEKFFFEKIALIESAFD
jgi:release factor glutamine methyltransferase